MNGSGSETLTQVLATKLNAASLEVESRLRLAADRLASAAKYEGGRFRPPSFDEACAGLLGVIPEKEAAFVSVIRQVAAVRKPFPNSIEPELRTLIEQHFSEDAYANRFKAFVERIERQAASYGIKLDRHVYRTDIYEAAYKAGYRNCIRRSKDNLFTELSLYTGGTSESGDWRDGASAVNDALELKPNIMGLGINVNEILRRLLRRK